MRTLTPRLAPHARTAWRTFAAVAVAALVVAMATVLLNHGDRMAVVGAAFAWLLGVVFLAACLDAVLVPGNPDVRRGGQTAGWSGSFGAAGWSDGGGHGGGGDGGSSCG